MPFKFSAIANLTKLTISSQLLPKRVDLRIAFVATLTILLYRNQESCCYRDCETYLLPEGKRLLTLFKSPVSSEAAFVLAPLS